MCFLRLEVANPIDGPFTGQFPLASGASRGFSTISSACVAGTFSSSANFANENAPASGSVTITKYVDGVEVAGSFVAQYDDGTVLSSNFDVPFCSVCVH